MTNAHTLNTDLLGTAPAHWERRPLWTVTRRRTETGHSDAKLLSVYRDYGIVPKNSRDDNFNRASEDLNGYRRVKRGDLVLNKMKTWQGSLGVSDYDGIVSPAYFVCSLSEEVHPRFAHHLLRSHPYIHLYQAASKGIRPGQWDLPYDQFRTLPILLPPFEEQHRIAGLIDSQVTRVDELITKKRELLDLMEESIDSRILDQVKGSPIAASNLVPLKPIRRILTKVSRPPTSCREVLTAFRDGQVTERTRRRSEGYTLSASTEPQGQLARVGDVVIHGLDGFAGAIGVAEAEGNCSSVYHVCTPQSTGDSYFIGRLLRVLALQGYLGGFTISTRERALDFRNWDLFGRIQIPDVPESTQRDIGARIQRIKPLRETIQRSLKLMAEHRQAFITAAVMGKFDASTSEGPYVTE